MQHYLYKHYGRGGSLLYVGITRYIKTRTAQHKFCAHWFGLIEKIEYEIFPSRKEAFLAEKRSIQNDRPLYNVPRKKRTSYITHQTIRNLTEESMRMTFDLSGTEIEEFNRAMELSGFRSKSEFIRFCMFAGIKELYGEKMT